MRTQSLEITANIKAAEIANNLDLYQTSVQSIATRVLVQIVLQEFNNADRTNANGLSEIVTDFKGVLSGGGRDALFLQAQVFPKSDQLTGNDSTLVRITGSGAKDTVLKTRC